MDVVNALVETWPRREQARRAFGEVAREHLDDVYRYLVFLTADPLLAEDLAAETFEKAFRSWKRFDPRRGGERTWLCQVARSRAFDHFRSEARRRKRETHASGRHPSREGSGRSYPIRGTSDRSIRSYVLP